MRFVAAAMVVVYHAGCAVTTRSNAQCSETLISNIGAAGVDIFFVISGLVISLTGPLADPAPSGAEFLWRRWSRVAPIFYLISLPFIARSLIKGSFNIPQLVATLFFWPAFGPEIVTPFLQAGWTLGFEMLFYTAMSAVLFGGRIRRNFFTVAICGFGLVLARLVSGWNPLRILANPMFIEFGFGVGLALVLPRLRKLPLALGLLLIAIGAAAFTAEAVHRVGDSLFVLSTLQGDNAFTRVVLFGVPGAFVVAGACVCDRFARNAVVRFMAWLGDASYSTYLSQALVVPTVSAAVLRLLGGAGSLVSGAVIAGLAIAIGAAVYVLIERPILRDLRRLRLVTPRAAGAST